MSWAAELNIIRRYLRDPDGNIWGNSLIMGLYNQAQNELQQRTGILEDVSGVSVPPLFSGSYLYDYEWGYAAGTVKYRCMRNNGNNFSFCHRWEIQENYGAAGDVADEGIAYTQPWEAYAGQSPGSPPPFPLPQNVHTIKGLFHDSVPVPPLTKKEITRDDPSWVTRESVPVAYWIEDAVSNQFYLYGQTSTVTWPDESGSGMVTSVDDYTVGEETGIITQISGGLLSGEEGVAVDVVDDDDNILIIYSITPKDIASVGDDPDFPVYLNKYIRYRVLSLAYGANCDGKIESLSRYWGNRAMIGLKVVKRFMNNRSKDRDFRLRTHNGFPTRNIKHPRLPSGYPAV